MRWQTEREIENYMMCGPANGDDQEVLTRRLLEEDTRITIADIGVHETALPPLDLSVKIAIQKTGLPEIALHPIQAVRIRSLGHLETVLQYN